MTKAEKAQLEAALTASALRTTMPHKPDVPPPEYGQGLTKGWAIVGERGDNARVEPACSSSIGHGVGSQDKTTSQHSKHLYSSELLALKALRYEVEQDCARRLRRIDTMIASKETANG